MKGLILAGGKGTRLQPFTKIINKHLLPVGTKPMIYWSIEKLKQAGIEDIFIVTNKEHLSSFIQLLGYGEECAVRLTYGVQDHAAGIADAVSCARDFVNNERLIVLLGDNIFEDPLSRYIEEFNNQSSGARVLLKKVNNPKRYGIANVDHENHRITSITEKPQNQTSSYCVTGIYMYDQKVFDFIDQIEPSKRGELEITDVNNLYIDQRQLNYNLLQGWWVDAGTHDSLQQVNRLIFNRAKHEKGGFN